MAEAGPSSSSLAYSSASSPPQSRHSRIHFPADEDRTGPRDDSYNRLAIGLGAPPFSRRSTAGQGKSPAVHLREEGRRRVRSVDTPPFSSRGQARSQRAEDINGPTSKRMSATVKRSSRRERGLSVTTVFSDGTGDSHSLAFSDEYDLSREDPRIMEDVQRAIRLKARREARLKAAQSNIPKDALSAEVVSAHSSPLRVPMQIPPPIVAPQDMNLEAEIDFSPSIGTMPLHPVPASADNGATLDWTGSTSEDEKSEKRWTLGLAKRKPKDKSPLPSSRTIVEKQDSLYADKLSRIKNSAKQHTLRKAAITSDQLARQYNLLLAPPDSYLPPVNLLRVMRWYDKQESLVQGALDKAEPLTWLKHLHRVRGGRSSRPPWAVSALVIEEYVKAHINPHLMAAIPEDEIAPGTSPTVASFAEARSPSSVSTSWTPPHQFLEPSISRKRSSFDAHVSFEPLLESGRDSLGADSRPSSEGGLIRYWRHSLPNGTDSGRSSVYGGIFNNPSPTSSRLHLRDIARRIRRRPNGSDDALSSAPNSASERSASEDGHVKMLKSHSQPASVRMRSPSPTGTNGDERPSSRNSVYRRTRARSSSELATTIEMPDGIPPIEPTPKPVSTIGPESSPSMNRAWSQRRMRISLPSSIQTLVQEQDKRQREVDEEKERQEYDRKAQILEDTLSQNYRIRHLLQRVGASIREYDTVQSNLSAVLGASYPRIPPDAMDAFTHDPSAVTNVTRSLHGWHAVEDIHNRVQLQRDTLSAYVSSLVPEGELSVTAGNVFDDAVASLARSLKQLEDCRQLTRQQGERVLESLSRVKEVHAAAKREYNDALSYTSLVYPEISYIVALEESWRNHYQQFWDIGLDALTLLLDTVTPFWRNYGKVIGEDIQDFLIIPWYRNEFTGEPKRYPIKHFPRRSLRHWVGLLFLSFASVCFTTLQVRAALSSTFNCHLPWITHAGLWWITFPLFIIGVIIQWCAALIECSIIVAQSGVLIWWLGWLVNIVS